MWGDRTKRRPLRGVRSEMLSLMGLSIGTVGIHGFDLLTFLLYPLQEFALDVHHVIRIPSGWFGLMAKDDFACLAVLDPDVLVCHIPAPIISLKIRLMNGARNEPWFGVNRLERQENSLLVGVLVAAAVMRVLRVMRIVPGTIAAQFVGVIVVTIRKLAGVGHAGFAALDRHLVESMDEMGAKMPFLGMCIQDLLVAFHLIHMLAKNFAVRTIGKSLGRNNHSRLSESGMAGSLDGASTDGSLVTDVEDFRDRLHGAFLYMELRPRLGIFDRISV